MKCVTAGVARLFGMLWIAAAAFVWAHINVAPTGTGAVFTFFLGLLLLALETMIFMTEAEDIP